MVDTPENRLVRLEGICWDLLDIIGEDPTRPGLQETPRRFAKFWEEFSHYDPGTIDTAFESVTADQMVVVKGIEVWSLCEHHLLPFRCSISIGYIASDKILGLSKFARIAQMHAHKLQVQERLVADIAGTIFTLTGTEDVAVVADGVHTCMAMRGVRSEGRMLSSFMGGAFRAEGPARAEFFSLIGGQNGYRPI